VKKFLVPVILLLLVTGCHKRAEGTKPELHLLIWSDYLDKALIEQFEKEANCRVMLDNFDSGEALVAKLEHVPSGYDVVVPSDEIMSRLIADGKLEHLDPTKLPNFKYIAARFRGMSFDPQNEYSVPFHWGTTGVAYDTKRMPVAPDSWAALFNPTVAAKGAILDDPREVFAAALRIDGAALSTVTAEQLSKARQLIAKAKPRAWESQPQKMLIQGDVTVAQMYSGDAAQVAAERGGIAYVIPKEGGTIWLDNLSIAKGSAQLELAHRLINFLMRPDVAGANTNFKKYPSPNEAAKPYIRKEILENPIIYPSEADLKRCTTLGEMQPEMKKKMMESWAKVKETQN
jgi:spermidine/putrescine transport system substrate-binding protein